MAEVGRLRANHPGVIEVSASPTGQVGAFQIIPQRHAKQLAFSQYAQWMVVCPEDTSVDGLEGMPPLFAGYLQPRYTPDWHEQDDWLGRLLDRYRCNAGIGGGDWQRMPVLALPNGEGKLPDWAVDCLSAVSHLRIRTPTPWRHSVE